MIPRPPYHIIDREEPVQLFHQLLDSSHPCRFMRLLGAAKMGKSHLLTKIFPNLVQQQGARYVIMDMRGYQTATEWLYHISTQLDITRFPTFDRVYQEWINRPQIQAEGIQAVLSFINMRSRQEDDAPRMLPHFTQALVEDLSYLDEQPIVLLCDAVNDAPPDIQSWLMNSLLVQLQPLSHLHVVVSGQTLPDAAGNYAAICHSYELTQVEDDNAYIDYCQARKIDVETNIICAVAKISKYAPGSFIENVHVLSPQEAHRYG